MDAQAVSVGTGGGGWTGLGELSDGGRIPSIPSIPRLIRPHGTMAGASLACQQCVLTIALYADLGATRLVETKRMRAPRPGCVPVSSMTWLFPFPGSLHLNGRISRHPFEDGPG